MPERAGSCARATSCGWARERFAVAVGEDGITAAAPARPDAVIETDAETLRAVVFGDRKLAGAASSCGGTPGRRRRSSGCSRGREGRAVPFAIALRRFGARRGKVPPLLQYRMRNAQTDAAITACASPTSKRTRGDHEAHHLHCRCHARHRLQQRRRPRIRGAEAARRIELRGRLDGRRRGRRRRLRGRELYAARPAAPAATATSSTRFSPRAAKRRPVQGHGVRGGQVALRWLL